jgi:hypothetical protein
MLQGEIELQILPLLGWDGKTLVAARAWSATRMVACSLNETEHQRRSAGGPLPVADPVMLRCALSSDAGFRDAPRPVTIAGAIAVRRTWEGATANLGGFSGFGALVAVLPPKEAMRPNVELEAAVEGYGVVAWDGRERAWLIHYPDTRPGTGGRTWVHRLVDEIVYDALLSDRHGDHAISATERPSSADNPECANPRGRLA